MADRRLYAQFTLDYADSHKIAPLSDAAFRAHVRMILWSRRMLTDGRIPAPMALLLCNRKKKVLTELTTNDAKAPSLIQDANGDYLLHDFLDHQPSRAAVEAKQETNRANGARGGQAKAKRTSSDSVAASASDSVGERVANFYTETETKTPLPSEGGREAPAPPVDNSQRPAATCPKHPTGTTAACRACGDARRAHDAWTPPATAPRQPPWDPTTHCEHGQLIGACDACEQDARDARKVLYAQFGGAA